MYIVLDLCLCNCLVMLKCIMCGIQLLVVSIQILLLILYLMINLNLMSIISQYSLCFKFLFHMFGNYSTSNVSLSYRAIANFHNSQWASLFQQLHGFTFTRTGVNNSRFITFKFAGDIAVGLNMLLLCRVKRFE